MFHYRLTEDHTVKVADNTNENIVPIVLQVKLNLIYSLTRYHIVTLLYEK
jgi:hypothetical protein